ncbi:SGNH/GDSL hydrolase family protein [Gordonia alkanivorans]|uniref:SGNH/GDSL hydrolase family protein n=1 Tax=Gordonia alkanivorans TaxID=84096 RepID=UPI00244D095D|nr:SGNH/GDSL hydrolase family protein [Gordonia alkanivorans]MDH3022463.1 SGNH/GDSL hydrolase family protein [Gordonia alkanivorans]
MGTIMATVFLWSVATSAPHGDALTLRPNELDAVSADLRNPDPYSITVVGDSTANNADEWGYRLADRIASTFKRTVIVHDWSIEQSGYNREVTVGAPGRPLVDIWNGSASGKGPAYSIENWAKLSPEPAKLYLINHGHNVADPSRLVDGVNTLARDAKAQNPLATVGIVLQNPRMDSPERQQSQQDGVDRLRSYVEHENIYGAAVIDVNRAYYRAGDVALLLREDRFHPNVRGSVVAADTIAARLDIS